MNQIEHDKNEPKIDRSNTVFYVAWAIVAFIWVGAIFTRTLDWPSIFLGASLAAVLIITVNEKSINQRDKR